MRRIIRGILSIFLALVLSLGIYIVYYNNTKLDKQIKYKEIIQKELKETGKLVILEGVTQHISTLEETKKLFGTPIEIGNKTIILNLRFNYGYSVDLSSIKVDTSKDIILIINSESIVLDYIYLDVDNSYIESSSSLLVKNYTPEEINEIQKTCILNVRDGLLKNEENILKAKASLEKQLKLMIGKIANSQAIIRYE